VTTVSGVVTVEGGGSSGGAVVELANAQGDVVDQVQTDDRGGYVYHLSPGFWTLRAWDGRGGRAQGRANVAEGNDLVLNLELRKPEGGHR
jgi:hypothetical protein